MTCVSENSVRRTIRWKLKISLLFRTLLFCYIVVNNSLGKIFVDDTTSGYEGVVIGVADDGSYDEENAVQLINNIMVKYTFTI